MNALKMVEEEYDITGNTAVGLTEPSEANTFRFVSLNTSFILDMRRLAFCIRFNLTGCVLFRDFVSFLVSFSVQVDLYVSVMTVILYAVV